MGLPLDPLLVARGPPLEVRDPPLVVGDHRTVGQPLDTMDLHIPVVRTLSSPLVMASILFLDLDTCQSTSMFS